MSSSSNKYLKNISPPSEPGHPLVLNILIVDCPLEKTVKTLHGIYMVEKFTNRDAEWLKNR